MLILLLQSLPDYEITGSTADVEAGAFHIKVKKPGEYSSIPEVYHTTDGTQILKNFVLESADVHRTGPRIHLQEQR